jgi:uncharacterized protein YqeY
MDGWKPMASKADLENALKDAMRAHDELRKRVLRMALASIRLQEKDKGAPLDEPAVQSILQKEVKMRQEAIQDAERADRADLKAMAEEEIGVLEDFLPKQLTPEELDRLVQEAIQEVGASSMRELGQVMKTLMPRIQGRAPGDQVSQAVRRQLQ